MRIIPAAALALLLIAPAARGQEGPPPAQGLLQGAEAGDVACYLRIRDDADRSRSWMAEFELCETAGPLIGRRVALTWRQGRVQHPACQGDPDCRRTRMVTLATGMKPLGRP